MPDQFVTTITTDNTGRWVIPPGVELVAAPEIRVPAYSWEYVGRIELLGLTGRAEHNGVMVAMFLPEGLAREIAWNIPGSLDADDLHITLAYLGKRSELSGEDLEKIARVVEDLAGEREAVDVTIGGVGAFTGKGDNGEDAIFLTVDSATLTDLRAELVASLKRAGLSPDESHAFYPHITVAYADMQGIEIPETQPRTVTLSELTAALGDERQRFTLAPRRESGSEIMDLLTRDLTTRLDSGADVERLLADLSLPVPVIASTQGMKDDGFDLRMDDWDLERYKRYSPILNNHSWWEPTLGRGANLRFDQNGSLRADSYFDRQDPFAVLQRGKLIQEMAAISVGWRTIERGERQQNQLYEYSVVSMPMDIGAQAVFDGRSAEYAIAIRSMADVESVRAWQMRASDRDLGQLEEAKEANRLLRDATPEEIAAWLEGAAWDQLDIIRSTWDQLLLEHREQEAEEEAKEAAEEAMRREEEEARQEVPEENHDQNVIDWSQVLHKLDRFTTS